MTQGKFKTFERFYGKLYVRYEWIFVSTLIGILIGAIITLHAILRGL